MGAHVALLRGINVGPNHRISMPELRAHLGELGYGEVRTVVQSGNIVVESTARPARLEQDLRTAIAARFGVDVPIVVRTAKELAAIVQANPFPEAVQDPKRFHVYFLESSCPPADAQTIEAADVAPEQVRIAGREIYAWHVNGVLDSTLSPLLTRKLSIVATARNWNTVTKLLELTQPA
jgi:uncharacterized protein (DUF1697 family)